MQNRKLTIQGVMNFDKVSLDLTGIGGKIIAVSGGNGAGKTTLLECLGFTSLYREFPSRGRGIDKFCSSNAYLENEFEFGGNLYISKMLINAKSGKVESYLYENGVALNDGKKDSFSEVVIKRFGTKELALSSVFSAQDKVGSFISIHRTERKNLFISMLNLGVLQDISGLAKDMEGQEEAKEKELTIKIESIASAANVTIPDRDKIEGDIEISQEIIKELESKIDQSKLILASENEKQKEQKELHDKRSVLMKSYTEIERRYKANALSISNTQSNIKNLNINTDIEALRIIAKGLPLLEVKKDAMELQLRRVTNEQTEYQKKNTEIQNKISSEKKDLDNANRDKNRAVESGARLGGVPCGGEGIYSGCPLIQSSVKDRDSIPTLNEKILSYEKRIAQYEEERSQLVKPAGDDKIGQEIAFVGQEIQRARKAEKEIAEAQANKDKVAVYNESLKGLLTTEDHIVSDMKAVNDQLEDLAASITVQSADSLAFKLTKEIGVDTARINDHKSKIHDLAMQLGRIEVIKDNVESAKKSIVALSKQLDLVRANKRQWGHLAYAFGPRAIQSIEIDSSGPWISDIINELLRNCFGSRFTVKMVTQAERSDKSGMKDWFDIEVIDSEKDRTGFIADLSGGEKVIVSEAVSLGICLYNSNRGGIKWDTLYRDECSGALDNDNAMRYINMLRRAVDLGGFKRCLFIAHQPDLVDNADNKIRIANGKVVVS